MKEVLEFAKKVGIIRPSDLTKKHIPRVILTRLIASGQLEKITKGLYRIPNTELSINESLAIIALRTSQAVFCLLTALQFHQLTTQLPREVWIAMPHGSHVPKLDYPPIKMVQYSGASYSEGIETYKYNNITLRVYNPAKTIADCFKHRNKIGIDVALEALKEARAKNKVSVDEVWHFAKICRVTNIMRPYLEVLE